MNIDLHNMQYTNDFHDLNCELNRKNATISSPCNQKQSFKKKTCSQVEYELSYSTNIRTWCKKAMAFQREKT